MTVRERRLEIRSWFAPEEIADLCDHRRRHDKVTPRQVHAGEEFDALVMVNVCVQGGGDERAGVADEHLLAEPFGEDLVDAFGRVSAAPWSSPEPWGRPCGFLNRVQVLSHAIEYARNFLVGQLPYEAFQLVTLG